MKSLKGVKMTLWYFITRRIAQYSMSDSSFVGYLIKSWPMGANAFQSKLGNVFCIVKAVGWNHAIRYVQFLCVSNSRLAGRNEWAGIMCELTHNSLQIIKYAYLDIRVLALGRTRWKCDCQWPEYPNGHGLTSLMFRYEENSNALCWLGWRRIVGLNIKSRPESFRFIIGSWHDPHRVLATISYTKAGAHHHQLD